MPICPREVFTSVLKSESKLLEVASGTVSSPPDNLLALVDSEMDSDDPDRDDLEADSDDPEALDGPEADPDDSKRKDPDDLEADLVSEAVPLDRFEVALVDR